MHPAGGGAIRRRAEFPGVHGRTIKAVQRLTRGIANQYRVDNAAIGMRRTEQQRAGQCTLADALGAQYEATREHSA